MPANYNLRCRWDQTFRLPRDFSPYDTQLQAGAVARMEMTFANGYVLEFSSLSGDGKDGTFVYDSYKKGWFICPLNKLAALYLTFGGSSKALSATWAARLEKDGASQIVMSGRAIWSAPDITETGDSSSTGTGTGTFGQTVFVDGETDGVTPPLPIDFSTAVAMATQLAQDWATKTSAEVVAGQGYGAKKYAIDALASYTSALAIAAGLSASPYAYMLDGVNPAALFSAPKGLFMLNGAQVALSSLLSFSSAAKYTVGPDGNYVLNAANGPAWDWSTGRRRLLIEAINDTNYIRNSEDLSVSPTSTANCTVYVNSGGAGALGSFTLTETANGTFAGLVQNTALSVVSGDVVTMDVTIHPGVKTSGSLQMVGTSSGGGLSADSSARPLWGPGTITQNGGSLFDYSGVSAPTRFRITRTFKTSETVNGIIYSSYSGSVSGRAACAVSAWQISKGYGSSYIVSGASATARTADVVTAASGLLALLNSAGASFALAMRGKLTAPQRSSILGPGNRNASVLLYSGAYLNLADNPGHELLCAPGSGDLFTGDFGIAASSIVGGLIKKGAANGGAIVSDNYTLFDGSETSMVIGGGNINFPASMLLDELIVWPVFASNAGLQAQARVYS